MFKNLDTPPDSSDGLLWVDFAELRALVHPDKCFSKGDLSGVAQRAKDIGREFDANEKWRLIADMAGIRTVVYGDAYPFKVAADGDTLEMNFNESDTHTTYVGLLIASSLRNVEKNEWDRITRDFEETSFVIFEKLMPRGSEVRATWARAGSGATYSGKLFDKLTSLAADLRCTANFSAADFDSHDTGDGGIDLVAWHPMSDSRQGMPISFAQCGCSKDDWDFKQIEAHTAKHYHRLPTMHPWANYYFMPLDFRRPDGDWAKKSDLGQVILVDRLRLIRLAAQYSALGDFPTMEYVAEALVQSVA